MSTRAHPRRGSTVAAGLALATVTLLACGGPAPVARRTNVRLPAAVDGVPSPRANRNAPPPAPSGPEPVPSIVLWCSQPAGPACTAAQGELGLSPTPAEAVPLAMLSTARDLDDDCSDPELAELLQRIAAALGVQSGQTADQVGTIGDPGLIADVDSGGGCVNVARPGDPTAKVQAVVVGGGARFLVRVWEIGEV